jgi:hypothetical protein
MRQKMIKALREHAHGHIAKHQLNVEVYLNNPAGIGEHPDVFEAVETEILEMAKYQDVLDMLDKYFADNGLDVIN